eukprot:2153241-Amphidinium_carterae.1
MYYVQQGDRLHFFDHAKQLEAGLISPWHDSQKDEHGAWKLPRYPCEIAGLPKNDMRIANWTPGEYDDGVDNKANDEGLMWQGMKVFADEKQKHEWERHLPSRAVKLLNIPHMPGQPMKEYFARLKAIEPRYFTDSQFEHILRDLPEGWERMIYETRWAEAFGIHTEGKVGEWVGQEAQCFPAAYCTPRDDVVTICVGLADEAAAAAASSPSLAQYDYLEYLYAKDHEGKVMQIRRYETFGILKNRFSTYSFVPPRGTSSVTPIACFKIRGVWEGLTIEWDPSQKNDDMMWFTQMGPSLRSKMADPRKLRGKAKATVLHTTLTLTDSHCVGS